jgi:multidrug efflux pump subunit AcrB
VDVDWYAEAPQTDYHLVIDRRKAALNGISPTQISEALQMALTGQNVDCCMTKRGKMSPLIYASSRLSRTSLDDLSLNPAKGTI